MGFYSLPSKSVFVIGNGPSLTSKDLAKLHTAGMTTFAMNRIQLMWTEVAPELEWRPSFYLAFDTQEVVVDCEWEYNWAYDVMYHAQQGYPIIAWNKMAEIAEARMFDAGNPKNPWDQHIMYVEMCRLHHNMDIRHQTKPTDWHFPAVCKYPSSGHVGIQLAVAGGATQIFLVGMDLDFKPRDNPDDPDPNHFTENYKIWDLYAKHNLQDIQNATYIDGHEIAARECAARDVAIYNAGRAGHMLDDIYPRIALGEAIKLAEAEG